MKKKSQLFQILGIFVIIFLTLLSIVGAYLWRR
jgi:hypothetical protein